MRKDHRGPLRRILGIAHELSVLRLVDTVHWPRVFADILLFRVMLFVRVPREDVPRTVRLRDGTVLTYRLNRGDIQALREIWLDQVYMPPAEALAIREIVDLGANIGFTSIYLARRLDAPGVVAVEPDPDNVQILRRNLEQNGITATIIPAAVGRCDGIALFHRHRDSNLGYVDAGGDLQVPMVSMRSVIEHLARQDTPALLKIDIEGGEEDLFSGDVDWLDQFGCLMAELHPTRADMERISALIDESGLSFHLGGGRGEPCSCWLRGAPAHGLATGSA